MAFDDLIWKIWELEKEALKQQQALEHIKRQLHERDDSLRLEHSISKKWQASFCSVGDIHSDLVMEYIEDFRNRGIKTNSREEMNYFVWKSSQQGIITKEDEKYLGQLFDMVFEKDVLGARNVARAARANSLSEVAGTIISITISTLDAAESLAKASGREITKGFWDGVWSTIKADAKGGLAGAAAGAATGAGAGAGAIAGGVGGSVVHVLDALFSD